MSKTYDDGQGTVILQGDCVEMMMAEPQSLFG